MQAEELVEEEAQLCKQKALGLTSQSLLGTVRLPSLASHC